MKIEPRISLLTLGVTDLQKTRKFYETAFGWKASSASQGDVVFFKTAGAVVALCPRELLAEDAFWGGHSGYFADPEGHLWEVAWNPHFPLDENGFVQLP